MPNFEKEARRIAHERRLQHETQKKMQQVEETQYAKSSGRTLFIR